MWRIGPFSLRWPLVLLHAVYSGLLLIKFLSHLFLISLTSFCRELPQAKEVDFILGALTVVDFIYLVRSLIVMVMLSGCH